MKKAELIKLCIDGKESSKKTQKAPKNLKTPKVPKAPRAPPKKPYKKTTKTFLEMSIDDIKKECKKNGLQPFANMSKIAMYDYCVNDDLQTYVRDIRRKKSLISIDESVRKIADKFSENSPDMIVKHITKRVKNNAIARGNSLTSAVLLAYLYHKHSDVANFYAKSDIRLILQNYHSKKEKYIHLKDWSIIIDYTAAKYAEPTKIFIPREFKKAYHKFRESKKRFSIIPLGLYGKGWGHANILVLDNLYDTIYRFEPHGTTFFYNSASTNKKLKLEFKKLDKNLKYKSLSENCPLIKIPELKGEKLRLGPQSLESQYDKGDIMQKGDPGGFCAYWSIALIDFMLTNYKRKNFTGKSVPEYLNIMIREISTKYKSYRKYIRAYAVFLTKIVKNFDRVNDINAYIKKAIKEGAD